MTNVKETLCPCAKDSARSVFLSLVLRTGMRPYVPDALTLPSKTWTRYACRTTHDTAQRCCRMTKNTRCRLCDLLGENQELRHPCHLTSHLRSGLSYGSIPNMNYVNHGLLNGLYLPQLKDMMLAAYLLRGKDHYRDITSRINRVKDSAIGVAISHRDHIESARARYRPAARNRIIQILTAAFYGSPPLFLVSPIFIVNRRSIPCRGRPAAVYISREPCHDSAALRRKVAHFCANVRAVGPILRTLVGYQIAAQI
ncbi:hypothetical protein X777_08485 [Ooceraea biroi]|uniref:Uncharacterized protein n=1 Tax=Ooceraea biroi TaxID=2015173 RepID=A0A026W9P8_OOCBI|nr:hypothetical protein X777_08485 [Ooceraea biroi]